jgi:leucyl-tRNA---protein transferase
VFYHDSFEPDSLSSTDLDHLLDLGWYRMHQAMFTTSHVQLNDLYRVHWLRYPIDEITVHRSHQRLLNQNKHFTYTIQDGYPIGTAHLELHQRYRAHIDFDGALSIQECLFGEVDTGKTIFNTKCISVYDGTQLVAGGYFDLGEKAAASILHFYDHTYARHSLGRYLILRTIQYLKQHRFQFYYPGYVVEGLSKMDYKLFLGREVAQYFDPRSMAWRPFDEQILVRQPQDEVLAMLRRIENEREGAG